jgi:dolichyl-phosphate-mannose--protein O-mannosyl transferase
MFAGELPRPWRDVFAYLTLAVAAGFFVFFLPILVSTIGVGPSAFEARIWLPSWR